MSNGNATKLVRDGEATSYDEPPEGELTRVPEPIEPEPDTGPTDLVRTDDAESKGSAMDHGDTYTRQMDAVWSDGVPLPWINDIKGSTDQATPWCHRTRGLDAANRWLDLRDSERRPESPSSPLW